MTWLALNFVMYAGDTLQCALAKTVMSLGLWVLALI